jgi:hypothetical protein
VAVLFLFCELERGVPHGLFFGRVVLTLIVISAEGVAVMVPSIKISVRCNVGNVRIVGRYVRGWVPDRLTVKAAFVLQTRQNSFTARAHTSESYLCRRCLFPLLATSVLKSVQGPNSQDGN